MNTSIAAMNTSTPAPDELRRRTLLRNIANLDASPLRRRSLVVNISAIEVQRTDDDAERSTRRSLVHMRKRLDNLSKTTEDSFNESTKFSGEQEIRDHFQICTKLYSENKITVKNAWQLHIIDLLKHMAKKNNPEALQVAGTSLDISAKVYGIRVDDVHSDSLKLASTMARVADRGKQQDTEGDMEGGDLENINNKVDEIRKKKKNKRFLNGPKNTVSKDPKSLKAPVPKLESVFFSTRVDSEASAVNNLYTNMLKMDNSGYKFMMLSNEKVWPSYPDPVLSHLSDEHRKKFSLPLKQVQNFRMCVPFTDFELDEWDPDEEEKVMEKSFLQTQQQNTLVYDENGIPLPELDGSIRDIFEDNNADDGNGMEMEEDNEGVHPQIHNDVAHIISFRPDGNGVRSEYSYNTVVSTHSGKVIDQVWAGPSHWKLKCIKRKSERYSGRSGPMSAAKHSRRKEYEMINYEEDVMQWIDMTKKLQKNRSCQTNLLEPHKITLPVPDISCIEMTEHLREFILRPGSYPLRKNPGSAQAEYEVGEYRYDNPNDMEYCCQQNDENDNADSHYDGNNSGVEEIVCAAAQNNFLTENLIEAPEYIPSNYVPFALKAKKMDMKKLKTIMWEYLTGNRTSDQEVPKIQTTFSELYNQLPNLLPEKMKRELNCHLTFLALLHLCNEKNLALIQHSSLIDFDILKK